MLFRSQGVFQLADLVLQLRDIAPRQQRAAEIGVRAGQNQKQIVAAIEDIVERSNEKHDVFFGLEVPKRAKGAARRRAAHRWRVGGTG